MSQENDAEISSRLHKCVLTFCILLGLTTLVFACSYVNYGIGVILAAVFGAITGILNNLLDHNTASLKQFGLEEMTEAQKLYLMYRITAGVALGTAAAFLAQGFGPPGPVPVAAGFVAAYIFDVAKLLLK